MKKYVKKIGLMTLLVSCSIMISCDNSIIENSENEQFTVVSETADIKRKNQLIELAVIGDYTLSDDQVSDNLISFLATNQRNNRRTK